jgi:hypothetical protein
MAGAGASIYRWQFGEFRQVPVQEAELRDNTNDNAPSTPAALPLADKPAQQKNNVNVSKSEVSKGSASRLGGEKQSSPSSPQAIPNESEMPPKAPIHQGLNDGVQEKATLDLDEKGNNDRAVQKSKQVEELKQMPQKEIAPKSDEAEHRSKKIHSVEEATTKDVIPSGFQDKSLFHNTPTGIAPEQTSSPSPKPTSILPSARVRTFSTSATIKTDSLQKRDSAFQKK